MREYKEQLSVVETHLGDELGEEERNELTKVTERERERQRERERERVLVIRFVVTKENTNCLFVCFFLSFSWKRFPTGQSGPLRGDRAVTRLIT